MMKPISKKARKAKRTGTCPRCQRRIEAGDLVVHEGHRHHRICFRCHVSRQRMIPTREAAELVGASPNQFRRHALGMFLRFDEPRGPNRAPRLLWDAAALGGLCRWFGGSGGAFIAALLAYSRSVTATGDRFTMPRLADSGLETFGTRTYYVLRLGDQELWRSVVEPANGLRQVAA